MKFNIESLISEKREEREAKLQRIEENERERRERRIHRAQDDAERYERKIREHVTLISDCFTKEYSPVKLHSWFLLDHWTAKEGLILLCGFDPTYVPFDSRGQIDIPLSVFQLEARNPMEFHTSRVGLIRRLDRLDLYSESTIEILGRPLAQSIHFEFVSQHAHLLKIWNSGSHTEMRYPPKYFIDWAVSKKIPVEWLEWAKANKYYDTPLSNADEIVAATSNEKPLSVKERTNYLNIIGSLADLYWKTAYPGEEYKQVTLLADLEKYDFSGMGERNLKEKLSLAMKAIKS